jgi:uncharacterized membrane protein YoaK (UPF0700 family)
MTPHAHAGPSRVVPALLAFVAGAVDAVTVLALFGLFVAQVTGSFVTVGVEIVTHDPTALIRIVAIPVFFIAGASMVFLVEARARSRGTLAVCLGIEAALLTGLMLTGLAGAPFASANAPAAILAAVFGLLAMGVQSASVRLLLHGIASTNVMTTNTTLFAIDVAEWVIARRHARTSDNAETQKRRTQTARRVAALAPIMAGFLVGSLCGAVGFVVLGFWCLAAAIALLLGLIGWARRQPF